MKIGTLNGGEEKTFTIEKPLSGVLLLLNQSIAGIPSIDTEVLTSFQPITDNVLLTSIYKSKDGSSETMYNSQTATVLGELGQYEDGVISSTHNGTGLDVWLYVPFAFSGNLQFNNDQTLSLTISSIANDISAVVYGVEAPVMSPDFIKLAKLSVQQGQTEKVFALQDVEKIIIPASAITATTTLELKHTNGISTRYGKQELEALAKLTNDICYNGCGHIVSGYGQFFILDVKTVTSIEILRSSTTAFDIIAQSSIVSKELKEAVKVNSGLVDTTASTKEAEAQKQLS